MKEKVVVGLSGGVDSSVAALLLKQQGYDVEGVTVDLLKHCDDAKNMEDGWEDARRVADFLGIRHHTVDFRREFQERVIDYFAGEYLAGRTPNPCVVCNRFVKWEALLAAAKDLGAEYIATGHYARIERLSNGRYTVRSSVTAQKDQTYALYRLTQEQLKRTLMPVGEYGKEIIRRMAEEAGLPVANKPDSQDICFVPDNDYAQLIARVAGDRVPGPGHFVTSDGKVLGEHEGITHYTVGQRRGLKLPMGSRVFVTEIRTETNEVVIGGNEELFTDRILCRNLNFMAIEDLEAPRQVRARIRYNHPGEYCRIEKIGEDLAECRFEKKVRAATPGQSVVFYEEEHVLGGGVICPE